jgi:BlaI family penicillinase repressor
MQGTPKIGEGEWYVMKALWESAPLTAREIVERVARETDWSESTIHTMIRRLHAKGAIAGSKRDVMVYTPLIPKQEAEKQETASFLKRVYEGSVEMLVRGFIKNGDLTKEEIEELKKLLEEKERS